MAFVPVAVTRMRARVPAEALMTVLADVLGAIAVVLVPPSRISHRVVLAVLPGCIVQVPF